MAAGITISAEERAYLISGIQQDFRTDGRSCNDYNYFTVETGIINSTNGSAEVKLGKSHVLAGVKAELGNPKKDSPNEGRVEFFVDCTANASPIFAGRGGENLALELSSALEKMIDGSRATLESLCVVPGKSCWVLYVDTLVLECGGNYFDAISLAAKSALHNTEIPNLQVSGEAGEIEIDVSDDQYDFHYIDVSPIPLLVTVNKIGGRSVLDATAQEEACCDAKLVVAVNADGVICGMQKYGQGGLNVESTFEMIQAAEKAGGLLNKSLMSTLSQEPTK